MEREQAAGFRIETDIPSRLCSDWRIWKESDFEDGKPCFCYTGVVVNRLGEKGLKAAESTWEV